MSDAVSTEHRERDVAPATGLRRLVNATRYSLAGLCAAWRHEAAFRQECVLAAFLIPAGIWLGRNAAERSALIGVCLIVLVVELLNSAIEAIVDRIGPEHHPLSGRAKDLGSASVLLSLVLAAVVWGVIIWQRFA